MLDAFIDIFREPWTRSALEVYWPVIVEGILVSAALGLIGCFLVVRGVALLGDALSHAVLPGIVIGFLLGGSLHSPWILVGATASGIVAALLVETVHARSRVKEDASLGIIFTALFALGVVMINRYAGQADLDPGCVLYGNIESFVLQPEAIRPMLFVAGGIFFLLLIFYRHLLVSAFDPALAISMGISATLVHYALMAVLSLTVVTSFEAVGAILAVALLIMPGATARMWTDRMPPMLALSLVHGVLATVGGYWVSHRSVLNTSTSAAIVVVGLILFLLSWLFAPGRGVVMVLRARRRLGRQIASENIVRTLQEMADQTGEADVSEESLVGEMRAAAGTTMRQVDDAGQRGWVRREAGRISLTDAGRQASQRVARAHRLWEEYLLRELGMPADHVHDAAHFVEHHLGDAEIRRVEAALEPEPQERKDEPRP